MGLFYRTLRIVENGIKPAYVFDGKPPELKAGVVRLFNSDLEFCADICHSYPRDSRDEKKLKREERRQKRQVGSLTSEKFSE